MKVLLSHPTSNEFNRAAANGFLEANLLMEFYTSVASFPHSLLDSISSVGPLSEIRRRRFNAALQPLTRTWPWREVGRQVAHKAGITKLYKNEKSLFSVDAVYQSIDRQVAGNLQHARDNGATAVYAYEDGASLSFPVAKRVGLQCFYDLPIGYWRTARRLLLNDRERWPEWATTITGFNDSEEKLIRKDEELRTADRIFVASQFTAKTLQDYPGSLAPVEVIPYGFPPVVKSRSYTALSSRKPLKLLFVGSLSQRKGIADLFAVAEMLKHHVELTIVGHKVANECPALDAALAKHRWIPSLPHNDILKLMHAHDVLVFPSLFEGFGLVITEAMSQGTPVITTERTAGPDFIETGKNGWLIDAGSTNSLYKAIEELLVQPKVISEVGRAAMETARLRPWEVYGRELAGAVMRSKTETKCSDY